jgi:hypothetical protein
MITANKILMNRRQDVGKKRVKQENKQHKDTAWYTVILYTFNNGKKNQGERLLIKGRKRRKSKERKGKRE